MSYSPPYKIWDYEEEQKFLKEQYEKYADNYKRYCVVCNKEFYCRRPEGKYCSYRCCNDAYIQNRRLRKQIEKQKTCVVCGVSFQAKRKDTLYCSAKCKQKKYRESVTDIGLGKVTPTHISNIVTDVSSPKLRGTDNRNVTEIGLGKFAPTRNSNVKVLGGI